MTAGVLQRAVLHGAGRFAQHLLYAWLHHAPDLALGYWCDEVLDAHAACHLLQTHDRLDFVAARPVVEDGAIALTRVDGQRWRLPFFHGPAARMPWLGEAELWLECSGRYPSAAQCQAFLTGRTQRVLVSSTCWDADQTLVMGYNESQWQVGAQVLSYGSCTVNAFVPLAQWVHDQWGVQEAELQVIHNLPTHRLPAQPHPWRQSCTLEQMAPRLLPWLDPARFAVNYTVVPYTGASLLEFRFRLRAAPAQDGALSALRDAMASGALAGRYALHADDPGVAAVVGLPFNAVFHTAGVRIQGDTLRLAGYFDNENSAVRYWELAQWLSKAIMQTERAPAPVAVESRRNRLVHIHP